MKQFKLTPKEEEYFSNLKRNGPIFVNYISPNIMKVFDSLVGKGYAKVIKQYHSGEKYKANSIRFSKENK